MRKMSQSALVIYAIIAAAVLIVLANTLYVVDQTSQAVVLQFGRPVRVVNAPGVDKPGLQVKIPFLESVVKFDKRSIPLQPQAEEVLASNQERLVVDAFVRYRINDPLQFYRALRTEQNAADRLERLVYSSLRQALGAATTEQIISADRAGLMQRVREDVARRVEASRYGVEIIDLRIRRADLPEENQLAVYDRMRTQRQQEAAEIRAKGQQQAREIVATATKQAETTRGEGDAERARIFAESFGRDPSFAAFYRSMRAYEASMGSGDTTMILSPDSEFFRYFKQGPSG